MSATLEASNNHQIPVYHHFVLINKFLMFSFMLNEMQISFEHEQVFFLVVTFAPSFSQGMKLKFYRG